jgi:hypothetical protein
MADLAFIARTQLQPGTRVFGPRAIPLGIIGVGLVVDKTNWTDPNVKLSCLMEISLDAGAHWAPNGIFVDEPGGGASFSEVRRIAEPTNQNRQARVTLTVAGGVCDLSASIRLLDGTEPRTLP